MTLPGRGIQFGYMRVVPSWRISMAKEIGIPKSAPKALKKMDEKADKKKGLKEGSPEDLKADKKMIAQWNKKHPSQKVKGGK